jgi:malate dehydrogenase
MISAAVVAIISNPVNSTVPIAAEVLKKAGCFNPKKLLGVTTLDVVRANTFVANAKGLDPKDVNVPVIGGHAGITILPLLSQATPPMSFSQAEAEALTTRIQNAGTEVVDAKAGGGSATLSMAFAAARFGGACLKGLAGHPGVVECAYVSSSVTESPFFATKVTLGPNGAEEVHGMGELSDFEKEGVAALIPELAGNIAKGIQFANA